MNGSRSLMAAAALLVVQREFVKSIAGCPTFSGDSAVATGTQVKINEYCTKLGIFWASSGLALDEQIGVRIASISLELLAAIPAYVANATLEVILLALFTSKMPACHGIFEVSQTPLGQADANLRQVWVAGWD